MVCSFFASRSLTAVMSRSLRIGAVLFRLHAHVHDADEGHLLVVHAHGSGGAVRICRAAALWKLSSDGVALPSRHGAASPCCARSTATSRAW